MKKRHHSEPVLFGMSEIDLWHHAVLVLILITSFFAYLYVAPSKILQLTVGIITAVLYVLWGVVHHYFDNDLHFKNVIEYILIAVLGLIVLIGVLV